MISSGQFSVIAINAPATASMSLSLLPSRYWPSRLGQAGRGLQAVLRAGVVHSVIAVFGLCGRGGGCRSGCICW